MIYATHQANAYNDPADLRAAVESKAATGGFVRAMWTMGAIVDATAYMANDCVIAGLVVASIDPVKGRITLHNGQVMSLNGYVTRAA